MPSAGRCHWRPLACPESDRPACSTGRTVVAPGPTSETTTATALVPSLPARDGARRARTDPPRAVRPARLRLGPGGAAGPDALRAVWDRAVALVATVATPPPRPVLGGAVWFPGILDGRGPRPRYAGG